MKNYFTKLSSILSIAYKLTFIVSSIAGIVLWVMWWRDYKKIFHQNRGEEINKIPDIKKDPEYDWKKEWNENIGPELDRICRHAEEDDDELY
jgi:hypothetical protein